MTETNMIGIDDWKNNTEDLEKQQREILEKLHFSRTMSARQRLQVLQSEVDEDFKRVKELREKSYQVGLSNKNEIKRLNDEAERLRLESVDLSMDAFELETRLKTKRAEMQKLEKAIADDKITV